MSDKIDDDAPQPATIIPHIDPTRPPEWLMESAKQDPARVGWLVSGYLAGVEAARLAGACGVAHPTAGVRCGLHHGHRGEHSTVSPLVWSSVSAS